MDDAGDPIPEGNPLGFILWHATRIDWEIHRRYCLGMGALMAVL